MTCNFGALRTRSVIIGAASATLIVSGVALFAFSVPAAAKAPKIKPPGPPTGVTVIDLNSALAVSWKPPASDGGSPITGYLVTAESKTGSDTCSTSGATTCTVNDFPVTTKDTVFVQAENSQGLGKDSKKVKTRSGSVPECSYLGPATNLSSCVLAGFDLAGADLQDAYMIGASLEGTDLSGTALRGASMISVTSGGIVGIPSSLPSGWTVTDGYLVGPAAGLQNADLAGADLANADLASADLVNADLVGTDLAGSDLSSTDLVDADATNSDLAGTDLAYTYLTSAVLAGVSSGGITGTPSNLPINWTVTDGYLVGPSANLVDADLAGADLANGDLESADLVDADLAGSNVTDADISRAELTGVSSGGITGSPSAVPSGWVLAVGYLVGPSADVGDADLTNGNLAGADLDGVDLTQAVLTGVSSGGISGAPSGLPSGWMLVNGYLVGPSANLTSAYLFNADLAGGDLAEANLTNANLGGADLSSTDLSGSVLTGVSSGGITGTPSGLPSGWVLVNGYLVGPGAILTDANLSGANLSGADLASAFLDGADVSGADLAGTDLASATLWNIVSGGIIGNPSSLPTNWSLLDGYLVGPSANLSGANLAGGDLEGADLQETNLLDADLAGANLANADLQYAEVSGADLAGATLTDVSSGDIDGTPAELPTSWSLVSGYLVGPDTNLDNARLAFSDLVSTDLAGDSLNGAILYGSDMTDANLAGADLTNANLDGADVSGADLAGVVWSDTTCPDGTDSNSDGGTCADDEQIDQSKPDLVAQSNIVRALSSANSFYSTNGEMFTGLGPAALAPDDPDLTFTTSASTGPSVISMAVSNDGNGLIMAAHSTSESCFYIYENESPVTTTDDSPWSATPTGENGVAVFVPGNIQVPASVGTFYAEVKDNPENSECDASQPVSGESMYVYQTAGFPAL